MKAAVCTKYGPPEVLQVTEVAKPVPAKAEVCVRNFATAVTASDCIVRGFNVAPKFRLAMAIAVGFRKPRQPILGLVLAGEVESVGADVKRFKPGDGIYAFTSTRFGAYAEYTCIPEESVIALKPPGLTFEEAAAIPYGGLLALHFLKKARVGAGRRVLIYGASGAIGTAAVQLARYSGAEVAGVCSGANLEMVMSLGADPVIDYTKEDFTRRGERYDLVFNAVGKRKAQLQCEAALSRGGIHTTVDDESPRLRAEDLLELSRAVDSGGLKPVIDRRYPLDEIVAAHRYVEQGHKKGNVIITIDGQ